MIIAPTARRPGTRPVLLAIGLFTVAAITGLMVAFLSQASSPNYRNLFWSLLPFAFIHLATIAVYLRFVRHWTRWILCVVAGIAVFGTLELAVRVFTA